jgi:hypothetical protein
MQRIRGAAPISEENELSARAQCRSGFFRERGDAFDKLIGNVLLNASAFLELAANFFGV